MVREHGYSIRKLAEKLGKDKGYLENRLRLADAPPEIRELVSLRKDTLSHAYELMKVEDPKKRRELADQVARGELTLIKLRERIEGRRPRVADDVDDARRRGRRRRPRPADATEPADEPPDGLGRRAAEPARPRWRRLAGRRQAAARRRRRGARRRPPRRRTSVRVDRPDRPGEPGQVPDDRQAPARERDRGRPHAATATGGSDPGRPAGATPRTTKPAPGAGFVAFGSGSPRGERPAGWLRAISGHDPCPGRGPSASCRGRSRSCPSPWRSGPIRSRGIAAGGVLGVLGTVRGRELVDRDRRVRREVPVVLARHARDERAVVREAVGRIHPGGLRDHRAVRAGGVPRSGASASPASGASASPVSAASGWSASPSAPVSASSAASSPGASPSAPGSSASSPWASASSALAVVPEPVRATVSEGSPRAPGRPWRTGPAPRSRRRGPGDGAPDWAWTTPQRGTMTPVGTAGPTRR